MATKLFAYGTLRQGHAPPEIAHVVDRLRPLGKGSVRGSLLDLGEYPGGTFGQEHGALVEGEVYEVPDLALWKELDAYEGCEPGEPTGSLFLRRQIDVEFAASGESVACWVYEYNFVETRP